MPDDFISRLGFSIDYIFSDSTSKYGPLLVSSFFVLLSPLIIPNMIVFGYALEVAKTILNEEGDMPRIQGLGKLFTTGAIGFITLLPLIVLSNGFSIGTVLEQQFSIVVPVPVVGTLSLVGLYILPAVFVRYAETHSVTEAYSPVSLLKFMFSPTYIVGAVGFWGMIATIHIIHLFTVFVIGQLMLVFVPVLGAFTLLATAAFFANLYRITNDDYNSEYYLTLKESW